MAQQAASSGTWRLSRRVRQACGPATKFGVIERQLAEWVESGAHASGAATGTVEPYLAGYLDQASVAGRRWGRTVGIAAGVVAGLAAFVIAMVAR